MKSERHATVKIPRLFTAEKYFYDSTVEDLKQDQVEKKMKGETVNLLDQIK